MADDLKDIIRAVKDRTDIVAVISRYTTLKKAGRSFKGLSPFTNEKTPSFNVRPEIGTYHCFSTNVGGDVIDFLMRVEKLDFMESLKQLAREAGVELPEKGAPKSAEERARQQTQQEALESVHEFALKWFRRNLEQKRYPAANDYLVERDIPEDLAEQFQLGVALDGWDHLEKAARVEGYSEELLIEAGLCIRHEQRGTLYDRFRNRLIFPIRDHLGRCIGFGGRRLDDDPKSPKYLNSAETPLYNKSKSLYAMDVAQDAIRDTGFALLTEGYMDTIMAHRFGFKQAVASLGTAFTSDQARLLKRYAGRVIFLYDGDSAGQKAMRRSGDALLAAGLDTRVIELPSDDDPDTFLRAKGADALQEKVDDAREYFDFALGTDSEDLNLSTLQGQTDLVDRIAPLLLSMRNDVQREVAIARLLGRLGGLPREAIHRILETRKKRQEQRQAYRQDDDQQSAPLPQVDVTIDRLEQYILQLMLEDFSALQLLRRDLNESWIMDRTVEPWIAYLLYGEHEAQHQIDQARSEEGYELPGPLEVVTKILAEAQPIGEAKHAAEQLMARLKKRHHRRVHAQLVSALKDLPEQPDSLVIERLLKSIHEEARIAHGTRVPTAPIRVL